MDTFECFYSVLNLDQSASQADIKNSFRKLALQYHPDKNAHDIENSHKNFIKIQKAFETLSDPNERSWYDQNRSTLMFASTVGSMIQPSKFRNLSVFEEYNNNDKGFYSVYRSVFEKISQEEKTFSEKNIYFPSFGNSESSYSEVVQPFYSFWVSFSTKKSFKWLDRYDAKSAQNRAESRAIEKENKIERENARRQYNRDLRSLVQFIKQRDPRIPNPKEKLLKKTQIAANNISQNPSNFDWETHYENYHEDLDAIENLVDFEFCENLSNLSIDHLEIKEVEYGVAVVDEDKICCLLCDSAFTTIKSFRNHIKSRSHIEIFTIYENTLKKQLIEDFYLENVDGIESESLLKTQDSSKSKTNSMKSKNKKESQETLPVNNQINPLSCVICKEIFESRNKLFSHIKESGHAALKTAVKNVKNRRQPKTKLK